jgi:hypothetical protein
MALQFEFYREVDIAGELGGCIHYYDEYGQSIFLQDGDMQTQVALVDDGRWDLAEYEATQEIGEFDYSGLRFDHPHNGIVYGTATNGTEIWFLRYVYLKNISSIVKQGEWTEQIDNQIKQFNLRLMNIDGDLFSDDFSLFNPGHRLRARFRSGDSEPYIIGTTYLDETDFDEYSDTINVSSRNNLGFFLEEQTFDELNTFAGARVDIYTQILLQAGITDYLIQNNEDIITLEFEAETNILNGLNQHLDEYGWKLTELPGQKVIIGDDDFIKDYNPNGTYTFSGDEEVYKRKSRKNADVAYSRICIKREDGEKVFKEINNWEFWNINTRKTKYYNVAEDYSLESMELLADRLAEELQYVGIGEEFSGLIRPQIQVGDVASIFYTGDLESLNLGLITQVSHIFGIDGFRTDFSIDSGGVANESGANIYSRAKPLDGYNRKQRITDFIGIKADKRISGFNIISSNVVTNNLIEAISITPASIIKII